MFINGVTIMLADIVMHKYPHLSDYVVFNIQNISDYIGYIGMDPLKIFDGDKNNLTWKKLPFPKTCFNFISTYATVKKNNLHTVKSEWVIFVEEIDDVFISFEMFSEDSVDVLFVGSLNTSTGKYDFTVGPIFNLEEFKKIELEGVLEALLVYVFTSLNFLHCRNVLRITNENKYPRPIRRQGHKPKFEKFYTLQIEPMKKVLEDEGNIKGNGILKAFHICRGHFRTYEEDKPLFGKLTGTFWIPNHTRGSMEVGRVLKDYKI